MPNGKSKISVIGSPLERLLQAAAPGGMLTRRPIFLGLAVALIALIIGLPMVLSQMRARDRDPAVVRFSDPNISRLHTRSFIAENGVIGHGEIRQYGLLDDPNRDVTLIMVIPPAGQSLARDFVTEVRSLDLLRNAAHAAMTRSYEVQTRFGLYQAADLQIDMVGRWKDCLAFMSRFETNSIYIKGWYCDDVGNKPKAEKLACVLDSVVIDRALESASATAFMREHSARPGFCGAVDRGEDHGVRALTALPSQWTVDGGSQKP